MQTDHLTPDLDHVDLKDIRSPKTGRIDVRQADLNLDHWYPIALSSELGVDPLSVTVWEQPILLMRDAQGQAHALEDRCPHRFVKLSHGQRIPAQEIDRQDMDPQDIDPLKHPDLIECAYHGWRFDLEGQCYSVPYLADDQKLPTCRIRTFPLREQDGFVWIFPGDPQHSERKQPLALPEWDDLNAIVSVTQIQCQAHFSFLIENLMDMYHGHLHNDLQAWADPQLQELTADERRVEAHYQAQSYYQIDKIWSVSQLFFPALRRLHPELLTVSYIYPHWISTLGKDFKICCLFCPIDLSHTRAYLIHFTSLHAFHRLHKLPIPFRRWVKDLCFGAAEGLLKGLVRQDVLMIEEEQQAYQQDPSRRGAELNRTIGAVQKLIRSQAS